MPQEVIVVGGGVIGLACAHYLERAGCRVTVLEREAIGAGCSHANCGLICPSHVLPLAEPGALRQAVQSLFQPEAPFRVKPRIDLALWRWFWHFARRCNTRDMLAAGRAIQPLLESSLELYRQLMEQEHLDCEWEQQGLLFVYRQATAFAAYAETDRLLAETFHLPAQRLEGDAVREFEPALKPGLAGGWYFAHDAQVRPDQLLSTWHRRLADRGVTFLEHSPCDGLMRRNGQVRGVHTHRGDVAADAVVIAAGVWTSAWAEALGGSVPIQPGKGYSLTMPRPAICPRRPLIFPETRVAVTPFRSTYRLGSIMEFAGYDASISPKRIRLLTKGAEPFLQQPTAAPVLERWTGFRPMTWDSIPIIGRAPAAQNLFVAAGHNMLGLSMAPATGRLIAELVTEQTPHLDPAPYALQRFAR
uniref:FAD-dependent oxidoreductase n=1 Tax=Schlesneria paludicola TaxID=360056 RepID=A0A7C4LKL0_9PLAN